jgi:hypothetical protein
VYLHSKDKEDDTDKLLESFTGLLLNMGVVGALILTMIFPVLLGPEVELSQTAKDFFGDDGAFALRVTYQALLVTCLGVSISVIHRSVRMYTAVNFWMPTPADKRWFIDRFSMVRADDSAEPTQLLLWITDRVFVRLVSCLWPWAPWCS